MNENSTLKILHSNPNQVEAHKEFFEDVKKGLSSDHKYIPAKYFYDKIGSELFVKITHHPDYYLTACELEIIEINKSIIADLVSQQDIDVVELGPGEGTKSQLLLESLIEKQKNIVYYPIDLSISYLENLQRKLSKKLNVKINPIQADFFEGIKWLSQNNSHNKLVLFLGSSIGNLTQQETMAFFFNLKNTLRSGDYVLIGYDLEKDKEILMRAYNDSDMLTRDFNLNLLRRVNAELGADFDIDNFSHYPKYNENTKAMESFLLSRKNQAVKIDKNITVYLKEGELIHTETSQKYSFKQMHHYATQAGFNLIKDFTEKKHYFADSLWQLK